MSTVVDSTSLVEDSTSATVEVATVERVLVIFLTGVVVLCVGVTVILFLVVVTLVLAVVLGKSSSSVVTIKSGGNSSSSLRATLMENAKSKRHRTKFTCALIFRLNVHLDSGREVPGKILAQVICSREDN